MKLLARIFLILLTISFTSNFSHAEQRDLEDGEHRDFYSLTRIKTVWNIKDGKKTGSYITYFEDGKKREDLTYEHDQLNGVQYKYFKTGNIERQWTMLKGKKQGVEKIYYPGGHIKEIKFYKNNRLDGMQEYYRKNGLLHRERYYKNGKLSGTQKDYWLNGNISVISKYNNGKLHGDFMTYSPAGELLKTSVYKNGKPVRTDEEKEKIKHVKDIAESVKLAKRLKKKFYDTGNLQSVSQFEGGVLHGLVKEYFNNGGARSVKHYIEGLQDGIQILYYDSGKIASRNFYKKGKYEGIQDFFYRNGVLRSRERYSEGILDGLQEYYYENGVLLARKVYQMGDLLRLQRFVYQDGVLSTIEELIENQMIVRKVMNVEQGKGEGDSKLAEVFIEADVQEYYDNGNLKLELEFRGAQKVFQRIYHEEGGLHYEIRWDGGDTIYYEAYKPSGEIEKSEYIKVHKMTTLVQHKDFCDLLKGQQLPDRCNVPTQDADKKCDDSTQCQAYCIAYNAQRDEEVEGWCSASSDEITGCYRIIVDGVATQSRGDCPS